MNMTTYFPTYIKRNSTVPEWAADPSCFIYLPLYAMQGAKLQSLDRYGYSILNTGAIGAPKGMYFDGVDDVLYWKLPASLTLTELTIITWFNMHTAWPSGATAYRSVYTCSRRSPSAPYYRSGCEFGRTYDDGMFSFRLQDGTTDYAGYNCAMLSALIPINTFHFGVGRYMYQSSIYEIYIDNVRKNAVSGAYLPTQCVIENIAWNYVSALGSIYANYTVGMVACFTRCLSLSEISQIYADTSWRYL